MYVFRNCRGFRAFAGPWMRRRRVGNTCVRHQRFANKPRLRGTTVASGYLLPSLRVVVYLFDNTAFIHVYSLFSSVTFLFYLYLHFRGLYELLHL